MPSRFLAKPRNERVVMRTNCSALGVLLLLTVAIGDVRGEDEATAISRLQSADACVRDESVDTVLKDRQSTIAQLIPLIDPANAQQYSEESRSAAAYLLGELRAIEAISALSRALSDPPGCGDISDISRYDVPVFTALVKIGRPAVPAMIANIKTTDETILRTNSLDVLNHVLGGKRRLLELLEKLRAAETDDAVSRRIGGAYNWAKAHYKEDHEPLY